MSDTHRWAFVGLASMALFGCESAWKRENLLQAEWMNYAEGKPREPDGRAEAVDREIAEHEERCAEEASEHCIRAGILLLFSKPTVEAGRAKAPLLRGCVASLTDRQVSPRACTFLGIAVLWGGEGLAPDHETGVKLVGERCASGDALACAHAGLALDTGVGGARDPVAAVAKYDQACSIRKMYAASIAHTKVTAPTLTREPLACLRLATMIEHGLLEGGAALAGQLYADVCRFAEGFDERVRLDACERGAPLFLAHGYTFEPVDVPLGPIGMSDDGEVLSNEGMRGSTAMDLAVDGCWMGGPRSCETLRIVFELQEKRGELFDLRPATEGAP